MLSIHHSDTLVGNLKHVISSCGWESVHAGDGAEEDARTAGAHHLQHCELAPPRDWDWIEPPDSAL
jgi:hypothetical protein